MRLSLGLLFFFFCRCIFPSPLPISHLNNLLVVFAISNVDVSSVSKRENPFLELGDVCTSEFFSQVAGKQKGAWLLLESNDHFSAISN